MEASSGSLGSRINGGLGHNRLSQLLTGPIKQQDHGSFLPAAYLPLLEIPWSHPVYLRPPLASALVLAHSLAPG